MCAWNSPGFIYNLKIGLITSTRWCDTSHHCHLRFVTLTVWLTDCLKVAPRGEGGAATKKHRDSCLPLLALNKCVCGHVCPNGSCIASIYETLTPQVTSCQHPLAWACVEACGSFLLSPSIHLRCNEHEDLAVRLYVWLPLVHLHIGCVAVKPRKILKLK